MPDPRVLVALLLAASTFAQTRVRSGFEPPRAKAHSHPSATASAAGLCGLTALAWHGQPLSVGQGTLSPVAFANPASVNRSGRIAFYASVNGSTRNQGIFVADPQGVRPIAMGCGQGGGSGSHGTCGDPSPLGGTFAGFFGGTFFAPAGNDLGDVLFLADVVNGSAPRGLFLYQAAVNAIVKIAAVGDPSPLGGTFGAVGPGALSNLGDVAFLGRGPSGTDSDLFVWRSGTVSKHAARNDPAPGGGRFQLLGTESLGFVDGTQIPVGPVPSIDDASRVAFRAIVSGGPTSRGLIVTTGGVHQWVVRAGDPTPAGGTFFDFQATNLNAGGELGFFADFKPTSTTFSSGWFAGAAGALRKVVAFGDTIDGGVVNGLAFSRNPMTPLDDQGNVLVWVDLAFGSTTQERLVLGARDGTITTVARQGDATPLGGTLGTFDAWPSLNDTGRATVSASTPGASGGVLNAHLVAAFCPPAITAVAPDFGPLAGGTVVTITGTGFAALGAAASASVQIGGPAASGVIVLSDTTIQATVPAGQLLGPAVACVSNVYGSGCVNGGFVYAPAVTTPATVTIGSTLAVSDYGASPGAFSLFLSIATTATPLPPLGTLLIGPSPLWLVLGGAAYPAGAPHVAPLAVPNDPNLRGLAVHFQTVAALGSGTPVVMLTNRASTVLQ